jgi:glycosyltransferase involved in cell wall biosynthesis
MTTLSKTIPQQPLVSIITPSYNQARFLEATIQSVLSQDYPNLEYIIVDGASTDGSVEIIQRYTSQISLWISEPDHGQTDAINKGFSHAHGEVFAWLNSDDTYLPGAITQAIEFMHSHPQAAMVYGDAYLIDEQGSIIGRFPSRQTALKKLLWLGPYSTTDFILLGTFVAPGRTTRPIVSICHGLRFVGPPGQTGTIGLHTPPVGKFSSAWRWEISHHGRSLLPRDDPGIPA